MKNLKSYIVHRTSYIVMIAAAMAILGVAMMIPPKTITVKGSDTLVILAQKWAENYMKTNKDVSIQVTGGGSGVGLSALINGTTDIADASRPINESEMQKLKEKYGNPGIEIPCAKDGITIYLNKANKVNELTISQLGQIYSGKIKNWKEVGGADAPITLYGRENSSGTYVYFKEEVVKGDYAANCQTLPGTAAVVNAVKKDKNGIGYGGAAYASGIMICKVKKDENSKGYVASLETVKSGIYPISRYLYMYVRTEPVGEIQKYIKWILSPAGQKIVSEVGYFPVK